MFGKWDALDDALLAQTINNINHYADVAAEAANETARIRNRTLELRKANQIIRELDEELQTLRRKYNLSVCRADSAVVAINEAVEELAFQRKEPIEKVKEVLNELRTKAFNRAINDCLTKGYLTSDPRTDGTLPPYEWYDRSLDPNL